jgi:hypothetical protein
MNLTAVNNFRAFLKNKGWVGFSTGKITTRMEEENGVKLEKKVVSFPSWKMINRENYLRYIKNTDPTFVIKTGELSNITAIDFDNIDEYNEFKTKFPAIEGAMKQKTNKGFHVFCNYNPKISTLTNENCGIDFRNDGGLLFSAPTCYNKLDGTKIEYSFIDGEPFTICDEVLKYFDEKAIQYTKGKKEDLKKKVNKMNEKATKKFEEYLNTPTTEKDIELTKKYIDCFKADRIKDYSSWIEILFNIKNYFGDSGLELFLYCSAKVWTEEEKKSTEKEEQCKKFYIQNQPKVKKLKKSLMKLKEWAKEDNPALFRELKLDNNLKDLAGMGTYTELKACFEKTNFKLNDPVGFVEEVNYFGEEDEVVFRKNGDFVCRYLDLTYLEPVEKPDGKGGVKIIMVEKPFGQKWTHDIEKRVYSKMDFRPFSTIDNTPKDIYNTFTGFNALKYEQEIEPTEENLKLLLDHFRSLCGKNEAFFRYALKNLAFLVKYPHLKNNICMIFKSLEGAGKDAFFNWFGNAIIGSKYYLNMQGLDQLETFNGLLDKKLLVVLNEFELKDSIKYQEKFKALITNEKNQINEKHMKAQVQKDYIRYVLLTNNDGSVKITQTDRRFTGIECDGSICNKKEVFEPLFKEIYGVNEKGKYPTKYIRAFFDYLLKIDCLNTDWVNERPKTEFIETLKEYNTPVSILFLLYLHDKGNIKQEYNLVGGKTLTISAKEFYGMFEKFRTAYGIKNEWGFTKFGLEVKQYEFIKKNKSNTIKYIIDFEDLYQHLINTKYLGVDQPIDEEEDDDEEGKTDGESSTNSFKTFEDALTCKCPTTLQVWVKHPHPDCNFLICKKCKKDKPKEQEEIEI